MPERPIRILHMASFARSGETLMLRTLAAHPSVQVVHQLHETDSAEDIALWQALMDREATAIAPDDPLVRHRRLKPGDVLLLKNGVWTHRFPWNGFVLVRNPFSVLISLFAAGPQKSPQPVLADKLTRWARGIDPRLLRVIGAEDALAAFCLLWSRKMSDAWLSGHPILRYEEFVTEPESWIERLTRHLGLSQHAAMLRAHEGYPEGRLGHGGIRLWEPIGSAGRDRHRAIPDDEFERIYALTAAARALYGYEVQGREVLLRPIDHRFPDPSLAGRLARALGRTAG